MLEIYNEEVQDLTIPANQRPADGLKVRENKLLGVYVEGVKKHFVTSFK
jgi:kinesin family protein 13